MRRFKLRSPFIIAMLLTQVAGQAFAAEPIAPPAHLPEREDIKIDPPLKDFTPPELEAPVQIHPTVLEPRDSGLYGSAEYLLLRPHLRTQDYALVDPLNDIVPQGRVASVQDHLSSGFRIGVGYRLANSGWDVGLFYTFLDSRGSSFAIAPNGGLLYPELTRPGLTDSALSAIAHARLNYNVFDLEMGKVIAYDDWTQFRLFSGIRFASIRQSVNTLYNGMLADNAFSESKSNFTGAGPIFGGEMRWNLSHSLSVFGKAQGGLIYGHTVSGLIETNNGGATLYNNVSDVYHSIVPMIGCAIGATWQYRGVTMTAGYQAVNWFGLIQRQAMINDFSEGKMIPRASDLSLDGFFFQLGFAF